MITYSEFIQSGIFIVALIGLCYTVFKGKKQPPLLLIVAADLVRGYDTTYLRVSRFSGFPH